MTNLTNFNFMLGSRITWIMAMVEKNKAGARPAKTPIQTTPTHSLQMKPEPQDSEKNLSEDLKTFEELPAKTQELLLLGDDAEKATGKDRSDVDGKIKPQSGLAKH